jgi:hypothetical protein
MQRYAGERNLSRLADKLSQPTPCRRFSFHPLPTQLCNPLALGAPSVHRPIGRRFGLGRFDQRAAFALRSAAFQPRVRRLSDFLEKLFNRQVSIKRRPHSRLYAAAIGY